MQSPFWPSLSSAPPFSPPPSAVFQLRECCTVAEVNFTAGVSLPHPFEQELSAPPRFDETNDCIILEPYPLATLPPEPVLISVCSEKQGGNDDASFPPIFVRESLLTMNMNEVFSYGNPFTWCNRRYKNPSELIFEKLDRSFMNDKWISVLPQTRVTNLGRIYSDHNPLLVKCFHYERNVNIPYKFLRCWQLNPDFKKVLADCWSHGVKGSPSFVVANKLSHVKNVLIKWNVNSFGHIKTTIGKLNAEIEKLQDLPYSPQIGGYILNYSNQLDYWYEIEHCFYKQKSRINYFMHCDKNTSFFHNTVRLRNMYDTIHTIRDDQGNWTDNKNQVADLLSRHFKKIYTSSNHSVQDIHDSLRFVTPLINEDMNENLIAIPSVQEIWDTVNMMAPWSSPGPDGFPPGFFKDNWDTVKEDVVSHVQNDCMLFYKAAITYAKNIIKVINVFEKASGQAINFDKSGFITSGNMHHRHIKILSKALNMKFLSSSEKYLGTPLFIGEDKTKSFSFLIDNFYARLNSSKKSNLNIAGRTVVTKHVLSILSLYHMACFPLPKTVTSKIDSIQRTFWWAKKNLKHDAYFRSWGDIGKSKLNGGLGLRNSFATNRVFNYKLGWRILKNQGSLLTRFLKDKYFPNQNLLEIDKDADSASWMWKGIIKGLRFIKANSVV
ncbi:uncharacterized protein LOC113337993 [Papaver somniferum]|uniref:uncharacterized protein LOC113337993 n=1 Tax=Papaver somniferum TaxID=3469 RepID=UPI000E700DF1|nr:uncharacterized protein LOC113337993 [Papaver somniferum]